MLTLRPVNLLSSMRWRLPSKAISRPSWMSLSRLSRSPTPACVNKSTVPCSSSPARTRARKYSGVRFSSTIVSIPANPNSRDNSKPAGPAPTIPTFVCMDKLPSSVAAEGGATPRALSYWTHPKAVPQMPPCALPLHLPLATITQGPGSTFASRLQGWDCLVPFWQCTHVAPLLARRPLGSCSTSNATLALASNRAVGLPWQRLASRRHQTAMRGSTPHGRAIPRQFRPCPPPQRGRGASDGERTRRQGRPATVHH